MNVDEFYDYITSQITPEEALRKMLESSLVHYEKLKFNEGEQIHPIILITYAAMDLGWHLEIESNEPDIRGIATGTKEYFKENRHDRK